MTQHTQHAATRAARTLARQATPFALALAALAFAPGASAMNIDTANAWDGSSFISSWGVPNTSTYGQTITAGISQQTLTGFTVYLNPKGSTTQPQYQAFIYRWDAAAQHIAGSALYSSALAAAPSAAAYTPVSFATGNIALTPGQHYVLLLTTSTAATQPGASAYGWGSVSNSAIPGGNFVFVNNGTDAAALSTSTWSFISSDLLMMATFAPTHVVETAVANTGTTSARGAAVVLDSLLSASPAGDLQTALRSLDGLMTDAALADAAEQTLPFLSANLPHATLDALHGVNRVVQSRGAGATVPGDSTKQSVWATPYGTWTSQGNHDGVTGYSTDTYGIVAGLERYLATDRIGTAFAYSDVKADGKDERARHHANVDAYQLIVYGAHILDKDTDLTWQVDYGRGCTTARRHINFGALNRVEDSDYNSELFHAGLGLSRQYSLGERTTFTPSLKADYARLHTPGYTEQATNILDPKVAADSLSLAVDSDTTSELLFALDGKILHSLTERFLVTANLGGGFDAINKQTALRSSFLGGGASFVTEGTDRSAWLVEGGLGLIYKLSDRIEITGRYDVEARSSLCEQTASVRFALSF